MVLHVWSIYIFFICIYTDFEPITIYIFFQVVGSSRLANKVEWRHF